MGETMIMAGAEALFFIFIFSSSVFGFTPHNRLFAAFKSRLHPHPPLTTVAHAASHDTMAAVDLPHDEILDSILEVAVKASKMAGEIILGNARGAEVTKSKANTRDLLTLID